MLKVNWREFYGENPIQPIPIEKYFLDDGRSLHTRQMTYECCVSDSKYLKNKEGMNPTFEVNDTVVDKYGEGDAYHVFEYERGFREMRVELLDADMKRTGKKTYLDDGEVFHKVKDVEWI